MDKVNSAERSYVAFISYRHLPLDQEAAIRIQKKIENYVVPKDLQEKAGGKKLGVCFRDEDELPASSSLSDSITYALDHSQYLIVVCTPDLPKSKWCLQEVSYFLKTHDRDHVLAVLADGTPEESFPEQLRFTYDSEGRELAEVEPLAANIAGPDHKINNKTFKKEVTRLIAAMLGCPFDTLWQRERRARTNRLIAAMGVGVAAMAVVMGIVLSKNAQISRQNEQIELQNTELQRQMSSVLVDSGRVRLEAFDQKAAISDALKALESNDPAVYDHRAERLLADSLGAYDYQEATCETLFRQSTDIRLLAVTEDRSTAFTADEFGTVRALDAISGKLLWEQVQVFKNVQPDADAFSALFSLHFTDVSAFYPIEAQGLLLCKSYYRIAALSIEDGSTVWAYDSESSMSMQVLSKDKTLFSTLDSLSEPDDSKMPTLLFFATATGEIVTSVPLNTEEALGATIETENECYSWGGVFSEDDRQFFCAVPVYVEGGEKHSIQLFLLVDLQAGQVIGSNYLTSQDRLHAVLSASFISDDRLFVAVSGYHTLFNIIFPSDQMSQAILQTYELSLSTRGGAGVEYLTDPITFIPALYNDDMAVLFHHDNIFMINLSDGTLHKSFKLDSDVIAAGWEDPDEGTFSTFDEDGWTHYYDYAQESRLAYDLYHVNDPGLVNVTLASVSETEYDPDSATPGALTVLGHDPGAITAIKIRTDPNLETIPETSKWEKKWRAVLSPSGSRLFVFSIENSTDGAASVFVYDAETGALLAELADYVPTDSSLDIRYFAVTDDEHFLFKGTAYDLNGNTTLMYERPDDAFTRVLPDGTLLFGNKTTAKTDDPLNIDRSRISLSYQLNDDTEHRHQTVRDSIVMKGDPLSFFSKGDDALFLTGSNGWLAGYGNYFYEDADGEIKVTDSLTLVVQNALSGEKKVLSSNHDGQPIAHLVMGNQKPLLACIYESGAAVLFDLETGECKELPLGYAYGEVSLACLSDQDDYLLIYSSTTRLDCIRTDTCERVYSESGAIPSSSTGQAPETISAVELPNRQRLLVSVSDSSSKDRAAILDTEAWISVAGIDYYCAVSASREQIFIQNDTGLSRCPVHSIGTLTDWARTKIEQ